MQASIQDHVTVFNDRLARIRRLSVDWNYPVDVVSEINRVCNAMEHELSAVLTLNVAQKRDIEVELAYLNSAAMDLPVQLHELKKQGFLPSASWFNDWAKRNFDLGTFTNVLYDNPMPDRRN